MLSPKTIATANLAVQLALTAAVIGAAYLARFRGDTTNHCRILRVAIPLEIVSIATIMGESLVGFLRTGQSNLLLNAESVVHHIFGLAVVGLWVYVNLVLLGIVRHRGRLVWTMRVAFSLWMVALVLGVHLYLRIWANL